MIKSIIIYFIRISGYLYTYKISKRTNHIKNVLFSHWIKYNFKKCGTGFSITKTSFFKGMDCIEIGENFNSLNNLRIECWKSYNDISFNPKLTIGNNVVINFNVHIACINYVKIGNNVLFASNIFITDHFHGDTQKIKFETPPVKRDLFSKGPVIIEDNVWIGENVSIMPNVQIGKGSIIGANSLVTKSFPENSIIGGVPAKIIKTNE